MFGEHVLLHIITLTWCFSVCCKIQFHLSCAIGRSSHKEGAKDTWIAYATDSHYNKDKYCCVAVRGVDNEGKEEVWYARVICFISFTDVIEGQKIGMIISTKNK